MALGLLLAAVGCSPKQTSEQRVRAVLEQAEQAAERKDLADVRGHVSSRYTDAQGHDRRAIEGLLRFYFLRHQSIHLLARIAQIDFPQPDSAKVVAYVAMAGSPLTNAEQLQTLRADLLRFELELTEEEKEWRVIRAAWRRAELTDFY
jgi:hypothetical protein